MGSKNLCVVCLAVLLVLTPLIVAGAEGEKAPPADAAQIDKLLEDLGADEFPTRERASRALIAIGERARPALKRAMETSKNMETRWRAEQILKRLDQEGARPLAPAPQPGDTGERPRGTPGAPGTRADDDRTRLEEIFRRLGMDETGRGRGLFGPRLRTETLEAPGLALEIDAFGVHPNLTLGVTQEGKAPATFRGQSLEAILELHPELEQHAGMEELKKRWGEFKQTHPTLFAFDDFLRRGRGPGSSSHFRISGQGEGMSVRQDSSGVTVELSERGEDGKLVRRKVHGESIQAIVREHPELKDKLEGIRMDFGPVPVFRRNPRRLPLPLPRTPPRPAQQTAGSVFGIAVTNPDPVVASHLKLDREQALLVGRVQAGSQAASMGVQLHDIIVGINDEPIGSLTLGIQVLQRAAELDAPLSLDVIRHGERMRLTR